MDQITAELFPPSQIPYTVIFARILGALLMGAVIGFEREVKARPAGLKTHMLVCLAACTFGIISIESVRLGGFFDERVRIDPLRVVEAVTAGVAFLAAGTIVLSRGEVQGLTTGASLWLAGAIGISVGFGHWIVAGLAVGSAFAVLTIIGHFEGKAMRHEMPDVEPEGEGTAASDKRRPKR
ncbi:MgtC/SapB family protein (plasmid) [Ensifer sp. PDNC004]|uniref:MgtC/SapB family protein n=1 Tax=unclassified Ensifer TaxID=2633371 RepID=UPI001787742B|nr:MULTISPECIES: MgtC/SapB family protein [unclassified Ensifer]MBD9651302.1 MgtC/SapB family protein [Ensifer sp. ENS09]QRY65707.1 MgtC/SapB family protein [Ensifer sp. PDNC004]